MKKIETANEIMEYLSSGGTKGNVPGSTLEVKTGVLLFDLAVLASGEKIKISAGVANTIKIGFSKLESIRKDLVDDLAELILIIGSIEVMKITLNDIKNNVNDAYRIISDFLKKYKAAANLGEKAAKYTADSSELPVFLP